MARNRCLTFLAVHWRGIVIIVAPIIFSFTIAFWNTPIPPYKYVAYTLYVMATFWVTECIPVQVTSFIPVLIFPFSGVMSTSTVCDCYFNEMILMFLGSIMLASAVEQSGLHKRVALYTIKCLGCSHVKMMFAVCFITMFTSMWITNTAATVMMVPIIFALLGVYEKQKLLKIYDTDSSGEKIASRITRGYFFAITYSATIGGIGTLVGTATNLVFKGLYGTLGGSEEELNFLQFSALTVPLMLCLELSLFVYMLIAYVGCLRPKSEAAKTCTITAAGVKAAKKAVEDELKSLGSCCTCHALLVFLLFLTVMVLLFTRNPKSLFEGWGVVMAKKLGTITATGILDSTAVMWFIFLMIITPSSMKITHHCKAKFREDMPDSPIPSLLDWNRMNRTLPYSFMFLLGGGFALSKAAGSSGLNAKIANFLKGLQKLPRGLVLAFIIIFTIGITNLASNVAIANVIVPIVIQLAQVTGAHPLLYTLCSGLSASFCYILPVGTPGNLIVQSAANIRTSRMALAGIVPTIFTIFFTWFFVYFWSPIIWNDLKIGHAIYGDPNDNWMGAPSIKTNTTIMGSP